MEAAAADPRLAQVARAVHAQAELVRAWPLPGGVSAQVTALEVRLPGGRGGRLVVRQYGAANLAADPHAASSEAELLGVLRAAGLPVPRPRYADESGRILPGPYLVVDFADGEALREPAAGPADAARQLAAVLAALHRVPRPRAGLRFLRDKAEMFSARLGECPAVLDETLSEGRIRAALAHAWPPARRNEPVLLHGDFWPGNTLWCDGRLTAVIDWEDAGYGDPLADLANGRLEIAMLLGMAAMREFTGHYRAVLSSLDYAALPVWDLCAALRPAGRMSSWGMDTATLGRMRRGHREFTGQALAGI
ncbi:MAG TPA: phosphotransferase family protein [Streptosporangiaceae bacterium]|jgi:aminoglycoside phosphotransferase (APT) family kinase protein